MRHEHHVGHWVVIDGVRTSYRGKLLRVEEHGPDAVLLLHPCYALESLADTEGEVQIPTTEEAPWDLYAQAVLGLGRQPKGWPCE